MCVPMVQQCYMNEAEPLVRRVALIHALAASVAPIHVAFRDLWPEVVKFDLLDTALSGDLAQAGKLEPHLMQRFLTLGRYAETSFGEGGRTAGILFTCSAFGPAIEAVKRLVRIPVLRPNEAAFDDALTLGGRVGLLVTFPPSLPSLRAELVEMARQRGVHIEIEGHVVEGALAALEAGDTSTHDLLVAAAAEYMPMTDSLVLGQFSLARAASSIRPRNGRVLITTPASAVRRLREILTGIASQ